MFTESFIRYTGFTYNGLIHALMQLIGIPNSLKLLQVSTRSYSLDTIKIHLLET